MSKNFCKDDNEYTELNDMDYMLLFKSLNPIRVSSKEYLQNKLSNTEAYQRIKLDYTTYKCQIKREIESSRSNKNTTNDLFVIMIFLLSSAYTFWVIYKQIYKGFLTGSNCCGEIHKYKVPIIYSLMSLVLFNPLFSLITVTSDMLRYRATLKAETSKYKSLDIVEKLIEEALQCDNPVDFTKESVCKYYVYLDSDCTTLCETCSSNVTEKNILTDLIGNKLEKLNDIHQFFENQKKFIYKMNNPFIEIQKSDKVNPVINCLLGQNVKEKVFNNLNGNDDEQIYSTN